jgi:hypothetical protein
MGIATLRDATRQGARLTQPRLAKRKRRPGSGRRFRSRIWMCSGGHGPEDRPRVIAQVDLQPGREARGSTRDLLGQMLQRLPDRVHHLFGVRHGFHTRGQPRPRRCPRPRVRSVRRPHRRGIRPCRGTPAPRRSAPAPPPAAAWRNRAKPRPRRDACSRCSPRGPACGTSPSRGAAAGPCRPASGRRKSPCAGARA